MGVGIMSGNVMFLVLEVDKRGDGRGEWGRLILIGGVGGVE